MWLGMKAAVNTITANSISPTVMWRMKAGGDQTWTNSCARYSP